MNDGHAPTERPPSRRRTSVFAAAMGLLYLASPGILGPDGSLALAVLSMALWGWSASRPGRLAPLVELLFASLAWWGIVSWGYYVWWGTVLYMGTGVALYVTLSGVLLRRIARRFPLAVAVPAAWVTLETLRATLPPPAGYPWMRLGIHTAAHPFVAGGAAVWGVGGLSWTIGALGGMLADLVGGTRHRRGAVLACGLAPLALGAAFHLATLPEPVEVPAGPRVVLVQPNVAQERKMRRRDPFVLFQEAVELTAEGVARAREELGAEPDLVVWGETMLPRPVIDPGLADAIAAGAAPDPWSGFQLDVDGVRYFDDLIRNWIDVGLYGSSNGSRPGVLAPGTAFLAGAEYLTAVDGRVRRQNAAHLWRGPGRPEGPAGKLHLVPGAETMLGLERFPSVRDTIHELAGYVPDLLGGVVDPGEFTITDRDGREWSFGVSICFDNAFDDPFLRPLAGPDPVDFHVVLSNEAWYRRGQELDQMVAFSRVAAQMSRRPVVRGTNSGVSMVTDALGRVERLEIEGRDREVRGALAVRVPLPAGGEAIVPPVVGLAPWLTGLWIGLGLVLGALAVRGSGGNRSTQPA